VSEEVTATQSEKTLARLVSGGILFVAQMIYMVFQMVFGILSMLIRF
jgi:hypothetical protein